MDVWIYGDERRYMYIMYIMYIMYMNVVLNFITT